MPGLDWEKTQRLMEKGAQIVEVPPEREFAEEHFHRAMDIPLKELNPKPTPRLDRGTPIVVSCWNYL